MIEFKETELKNGIKVIMYKKSEIPNVVINSSFHVGSKDEDSNKTGITHLIEHLMFSGSKNIPEGKFDEILHSYGGESNAFTTQDYTSYYLTVPSSKIEIGFWLDSDRFFEFPVTESSLEIQKKVVIEEKKQVHDNSPYGSFEEESSKRLFNNSGYKWQIIGSEEHIKNLNLIDIKEYYDKFYNPKNMVLTVSGNIDYDETLMQIKDYYEDIPIKNNHQFVRTYSESPLTLTDEIYLEDNITLPARFELFRTPAEGTQDYYALKLLSIALTSGESSRIYQKLINETNTATEAFASLHGMEYAGIFSLNCFLNEGKTLDVSAKIFDEIIKSVLEKGLTETELIKSINKIKTGYFLKIQSSLNISNSLSYYKIFYNNCNLINNEIDEYGKITNKMIIDVANKYLINENRVVLNYVPKTQKN